MIDDFDRISEENQEGAYKLFNCLNGKLPIIFVGDYSLITKAKSKYLQKIINHKIELPVSLYPMYIWDEYFKNLNKLLKIDVSQLLINLFIEENRNLRERSMFHYYVMQELVQKNKKDYVQIN
ncbi:protein MraZ, partial [Enterococcus gallinarum]